jgi:DNA-binding response OmpR family regulator
MKSILLVDDEPVVATGLQRTLRKFGFLVDLVQTPDEAHKRLEEAQFDLILVDFDLNKKTEPAGAGVYGIGLIKELRAAKISVPILVYTVLDGEWYEQASLDAGADDFILKTVPISTLLSRLHMHLRRHERDTGRDARSTRRLGIGRFVLDRENQVLAANEEPIGLTVRETKLLSVLGANPGRVISAQELLDEVWGKEADRSPAALFSALKRLRQKLEEHQVHNFIENVKGEGFKVSASSFGTGPTR